MPKSLVTFITTHNITREPSLFLSKTAMFRPPKPKRSKPQFSAATIPSKQFKQKRVVPVYRRKYPKRKTLIHASKILDARQLLRLSNAYQPAEVTQINGESQGFTEVFNGEFETFANVEYIELSDNNICLLDILCFPKLHSLYLDCNGIQHIGNELFQQHSQNPLFPQNLADLSLAFNRLSLESISSICRVFQSLISLDLSHNSLTFLPSQLVNLRNLSNFNLSHNKLKGMAVWNILANLPKLTELDLSRNRFVEIPDVRDYQCIFITPRNHDNIVTYFPQLQYLNLTKNHIQTSEDVLPVQHYEQLKKLELRNNPFLIEIWSSIKARKSAATQSKLQRYDSGVHIISESANNQIDKEETIEARPCDFGRIYSEIVLSRNIVCIVDDMQHETVFELMPIVPDHIDDPPAIQETQETSNAEMGTDGKQSHDVLGAEQDELDTNVLSLLQDSVVGHCKPNAIINDCIREINKLLSKRT